MNKNQRIAVWGACAAVVVLLCAAVTVLILGTQNNKQDAASAETTTYTSEPVVEEETTEPVDVSTEDESDDDSGTNGPYAGPLSYDKDIKNCGFEGYSEIVDEEGRAIIITYFKDWSDGKPSDISAQCFVMNLGASEQDAERLTSVTFDSPGADAQWGDYQATSVYNTESGGAKILIVNTNGLTGTN